MLQQGSLTQEFQNRDHTSQLAHKAQARTHTQEHLTTSHLEETNQHSKDELARDKASTQGSPLDRQHLLKHQGQIPDQMRTAQMNRQLLRAQMRIIEQNIFEIINF